MKLTRLFVAFVLLIAASIALAADTTESSRALAAGDRSPGYLERARELAINALSMIGIEYRPGGSNPDDGFDCSGFVNHVFRQVTGRTLPRDSHGMAKVGDRVERSDLEAGDLVFFNTQKQPYSHVGIYIGESRFVHAAGNGRGVRLVDMREHYWHKRYDGARRLSF